jgi:hypothetical protein
MTATQNIVKPVDKTPLVHARISTKVQNPDSIESLTKATDKMVTGTFMNIEYPGQPAKISAKLYKGQEMFSKTFEDNERCAIPLSVARFINERCHYDVHGYLLDEKGQSVKNTKRVPRYKFMAEF